MPATQVEFRHSYESLYGVFDGRDREHSLGMCHEAVSIISIHTCIAGSAVWRHTW